MRPRFFCLLALLAATPAFAQAPPDDPLKRIIPAAGAPPREPFAGGKFGLGKDEVVVFAGQTNFMREQKSGDLEALLSAAFAKEQPRFRAMSWEADTVYEQFRDLNFGSWADQLRAAGAGTVIAQFGQIEAMDGRARLPEFVAAYHRLLDQFAAQTRRVVLVSPMPFERPPSAHVPDLTARNSDVRAYVDAVREIAKQRGAIFIDLYTPLAERPANALRYTDNGMHLNADGLRGIAETIAQQLGVATRRTPVFGELLPAIAEKNRLWRDSWRPSNWDFVYGDRTSQLFAKGTGGGPSLQEQFEKHKGLIAQADAKIFALLRGEKIPPPIEPIPPAPSAGLTPEQELATFTPGEGWEVSLFASEKDGVVKPIQMSWDERGRLYVACSPTYPHVTPGTPPGDFILVCEDADGDGRADRSWKFAEGLTMVQGVEPGDGGLFVCDFSELVHLRDTDGDGKADQRRVIYSGFGVGDTHQLINSIVHGEDGALWFTQGLHILSRIETPWGLARLDRAGVWRLRPRTLRLAGFFGGATAGANCWGVAADDFGQIFHKSGDRPDGYWTVPGMIGSASVSSVGKAGTANAAYGNTPDQYHGVGALFQTNPKTTAIDIAGSRALPDAAQGCAVIAGFMGGVVELHRFIDDGAGFRSEQLPKVLRSSSDTFRPVDVSVGPDGAIYVADWMNPVIGHYQASYADPRRDKSHGRIWRISAKGRAPVKQPRLAEMKPAELLEQLRSPERWTRYQAKRLLFWGEPGEVLRAADAWTAKLDASEEGDRLRREVIGVFAAHESPRPELLKTLLAAKDARIRAYATRMAAQWAVALPDVLPLLRERAKDENPRVRLETIVAASWLAQPEAVEIAALAADAPRDRFLDYAFAQAVRALKPRWQPALASLTFGGSAWQKALVEKHGGAVAPPPPPGKAIYDTLCLNCHQPDGKGLPGIYPPLAGSEWVTGKSDALVKMLLHGLDGPITVGGQVFKPQTPVPMPPSGLTDEHIADVLTYVRDVFGNKAGPVAAEEVKGVREAHRERARFWTEEELRK